MVTSTSTQAGTERETESLVCGSEVLLKGRKYVTLTATTSIVHHKVKWSNK